MTVTCYATTRSRKSRLLAEAAAAGAASRLGGGAVVTDAATLRPGPALFYGLWRENRALVEAAIARRAAGGPDWYYADNGYIGLGSYRIARNGWQLDPRTARPWSGGARWRALGRALAPWAPNRAGRVLLCLQSPYFFEVRREDFGAWLAATQRRIAAALAPAPRPIEIRAKPVKPDAAAFRALLRDPQRRPWAVVARSSSCLFEALIEGVPAFATHASAALDCGPLERLAAPQEPPGRQAWAELLADQQWSLAEIERGLPWEVLAPSAEAEEAQACA